MTGCECKSGFFSLRDCAEPVAGSCQACARADCTRHLSPASGFTQCLDCWAKSPQQPVQEDPTAVGQDPNLNDEWAYGYRHRFYSSGYAPIYAGSHYSTYYDSYDTRSFDDTGTDVDDSADDAGAGFGDS
jgi:hypothetical protein